MRVASRRVVVGVLLATAVLPADAASLLPNGEQTFVDANGQPYSSGRVFFDIPGTLTPKTTWSDLATTTPNSNPVVLDAAGRAVIYGVGSYRQILKDQYGNAIWDQLTQGLGTSGQVVNPVITGGTTIGSCSGVFPINNGSASPIVINMPSAPADGDACTFLDAGDNSGIYLVTLALGAKVMNTGGSSFYLNSNGMGATLIWTAGTSTWNLE